MFNDFMCIFFPVVQIAFYFSFISIPAVSISFPSLLFYLMDVGFVIFKVILFGFAKQTEKHKLQCSMRSCL